MGHNQYNFGHLPLAWRDMVGLFRVVKIYVTEGGRNDGQPKVMDKILGIVYRTKATADSGIE